jgi:hypothetical protein
MTNNARKDACAGGKPRLRLPKMKIETAKAEKTRVAKIGTTKFGPQPVSTNIACKMMA